MTNQRVNVVLRHIRRLAARGDEDLSDRELLQRFANRHDEEAFARLLRRHRPMVQGLSLRLLHNWHDSEDVVQATFLVLARKAGSLRGRESVASWLYRVASHLALKVRVAAARRQIRESQAPNRTAPDPFDEVRLHEAQTLLDEELAALPDKYRAPIVLCCLEAATRDEAARQLGWSLATLKRRLAKGRELLRARLARRGLTLPAALAAILFAPDQGAAAAAKLAVSGMTASSSPSAQALTLAEEALRAMTMTKLKMVAALVLAVSALAGGAGLLMPHVRSGSPSAPAVAQAADQPKPEAAQPGRKDRYGDDLPPGALARLGTVRFRQGNSIYALDLSPDGRALVTVGGNSLIHLWGVATGKELHRFPEEQRSTSTYAAAFSPDGRIFATRGHFGFSLRQTSTGKRLHYVELGAVYSLAFAPDGKTLAAGTLTNGPSLWDEASGKKIAQLAERAARPGAFRVGRRSLTFAPDGCLLASTYENSVILWDVAARKETRRLEGHDKRVHAVAFSPDGKLLASGGEDRIIRLWDTATGRCLRQFKGHEDMVTCLVFTPNGKTLISGSSGRRALRLWDVASGEERGTMGEHDSGASPFVLSRDGKLLVSGAGGCVRLWDLATRQEIRRLGGHRHWIASVAFAPDVKRLATAGGDRTIRLWDATGRELRTFDASAEVDSVAFSPDGRLIASSSRDGVIRLWDASSGREVRRIRGHQAQHQVWVAFSPDGTRLASASRDETAALWDVATGKELRRFKGDDGFLCVAFSPDGKRIAAGEIFEKRGGRLIGKGPDAARLLVRVWDVTTGEQLHALQGHKNIMIRGVAFGSDGTLLASIGWDKTCLWNVTTGQMLGQLPEKGEAVAFSTDGRTLVTGGLDGVVVLWEVATRKERMRFTGHRASIHGLAFSPDGRTLASGSMDSTALLWDVRGLGRPARPADLEKRWQALADGDAAKAYRAIVDLAAVPEQAVPFLRERVHAVRPPDPERLVRLLADLDNDRFAVREKASKQIQNIGESAAPALRKTLAGKPSPEVRRRVEQLLANVDQINSPEQLRALRAVEVLEYIGTPQARRVLETLGQGAEGARLTRDAKASLARLARRTKP